MFKAQVRRHLEARGLTQGWLAQALGVDESNISIILSTGNPTLKTITRIAEALEIEPHELLAPIENEAA